MPRMRGARGGDAAAPITAWLVSDEEVLERVEEALAELEKEELLRYARDVFPLDGEYLRSPAIEDVARLAGVPVQRIQGVLDRWRGSLSFRRVGCPSRSRVGVCLRHKDYLEGIAKYHPRIAAAYRELREIQRRISYCNSPWALADAGERRCGQEEIMRLAVRAQELAEELGISEDKAPLLRRWLGLPPIQPRPTL